METTIPQQLYEITYHNKNFKQVFNLITKEQYETMVKPRHMAINNIESSDKFTKEEKKQKVNIIKKQLIEEFGTYDLVVIGSPIHQAIDTGIVSLPNHQGGDHPVSIVKIEPKSDKINIDYKKAFTTVKRLFMLKSSKALSSDIVDSADNLATYYLRFISYIETQPSLAALAWVRIIKTVDFKVIKMLVKDFYIPEGYEIPDNP